MFVSDLYRVYAAALIVRPLSRKSAAFMISGWLEASMRFFLGRRKHLSEVLSADELLRLQTAQFTAWTKISRLTALVGIVIAIMVYSTVWDQWNDLCLPIGLAALIASYLVMFGLSWSWLRQANAVIDISLENIVSRMRLLLTIRVILGICWAFSLVTLTRVTGPAERSLLYGIAIALMSTAVFGGAMIYALTVWVPVTAGAIGLLFATGSLIGIAPLVCVICYAILTFWAIVMADRQFIERSLNMLRLERHAQTIGLLLRDFEESSSDWLWETDASLTLRHVPARFAEVALRRPAELEVNILHFLTAAQPGPRDRAFAVLEQQIEARVAFRELVVPVQLGQGRRWWALTGKPLFDSQGVFQGYRGVGADVTAAHTAREQIAYLAHHDPLTDLANRIGFNDTIAARVVECRRQRVALLCLDLDEFKMINDTHGHDVGDAVLRAVAQRMRGVLGEHDAPSRLGGDEFAILLPVADRDEAVAAAMRVIAALAPPIEWSDIVIRVNASVGIAIAPDDADDPDNLYRNADLALYRAKAGGGGAWRLYDPDMDRQLHERRLLQRDMREALANNELFMAFQPFVDLETREMTGLEALVRWRHPRRGLVGPAEFIPIAEQGGLIGAIGAFVLTQAAEIVRRLPAPISIAVNLSPLQLSDTGLLTMVDEVLTRFGLAPQRIEFEVTESVMLDTGGQSIETLKGLRSRGHRIAIDDFGTGYSSLAVLRSFPFDRLKIDRSLIVGLEQEEADRSIVRSVIGLAQALGIAVTAEGVESDRQARILAKYRCSSAQGYYFARPLTPAQVIALAPTARVRLPALGDVYVAPEMGIPMPRMHALRG